MDKPLAKLIENKKSPCKFISEREVITNTTEIQRITEEYYEQLHANIFNNSEETDVFLKVYHLPCLNQETTQN